MSVCLVKRDLGFFNQVILEVFAASLTSSPIELQMWIVPLRPVCKCTSGWCCWEVLGTWKRWGLQGVLGHWKHVFRM